MRLGLTIGRESLYAEATMIVIGHQWYLEITWPTGADSWRCRVIRWRAF